MTWRRRQPLACRLVPKIIRRRRRFPMHHWLHFSRLIRLARFYARVVVAARLTIVTSFANRIVEIKPPTPCFCAMTNVNAHETASQRSQRQVG